MDIYVAGKTHDLETVREVQEALISDGHRITRDWTTDVEKHGPDHEREPLGNRAPMFAEQDIDGVREADLIVVVCNPNWCGTLIEIGCAIGLGKQVLFLGTPYQRSVFWAHPLCGRASTKWPGCKRELLNILRDLREGIPALIYPVETDGRQ